MIEMKISVWWLPKKESDGDRNEISVYLREKYAYY
jgi:hypothetical protein